MSYAGNEIYYCPFCNRNVTTTRCASSHSHCSLCNRCLLCDSHNPIPKPTKEKHTAGTSKSTKKKNPTSNVKDGNQTSGALVKNTGAVLGSKENPIPISLDSILESFGLLCPGDHHDHGASTSGGGSEEDITVTVLWKHDPSLGQHGSHNSKSKK
jgi:hypothetical protein